MHKRFGFTVVEIMIVILVLASLATIGGLAWRETRNRAQDAKTKSDLTILKDAVEAYRQDNGEYPKPPSCSTCVNGELSNLLTPKYLPTIPKDNSNKDYTYFPGASGNSYAFVAYKSDGTRCKAGKNMPESWFGSAPECDF